MFVGADELQLRAIGTAGLGRAGGDEVSSGQTAYICIHLQKEKRRSLKEDKETKDPPCGPFSENNVMQWHIYVKKR